MRFVFSLVLLVIAIFYTIDAFDLAMWTRTGRLGPGFFPRLVGIGLVVTLVYSLLMDWRTKRGDIGVAGNVRDTVILGVLSAVFILLLSIVGGLIAMIAFLFVALLYFNRGRLLQNVLVSVFFPVALYLLFKVWLRAAMPEGLVPLPF